MKKQLLLASLLLVGAQVACAQARWTKVKEELLFSAPPFAQCHASTLVEAPNGQLLVSYFGGTEESNKDVAIWLTTIDNQTVKPPRQVADGVVTATERYPTWNPVLFQPSQGPLYLFYKVGPSPREWWGLYKTSTDAGKTWSAPQTLPEDVLGPIKNKPVQLADGTILSPSSREAQNGRWTAHLERSTDLGKTWQVIPLGEGSPLDVIQPTILTYTRNRLQVLCRSKQGSIVQSWSTDGGRSWSPLSKTILLNPNSGIDAVTLRDGSQLLVYNPESPGKEWFNGRAKLRVAQSKDGIMWHDVAVLEDGTKEEYSYPAIIQTRDGRVHITYTYDRRNIKHVVLAAQK